jgi:hypothetical protein
MAVNEYYLEDESDRLMFVRKLSNYFEGKFQVTKIITWTLTPNSKILTSKISRPLGGLKVSRVDRDIQSSLIPISVLLFTECICWLTFLESVVISRWRGTIENLKWIPTTTVQTQWWWKTVELFDQTLCDSQCAQVRSNTGSFRTWRLLSWCFCERKEQEVPDKNNLREIQPLRYCTSPNLVN